MEMSIANENRRLREIVQQLLDRIDENQKIQRHFHAFELKILSACGIHELLSLILDESCRHFRLASASLLLVDERGNFEKLFDKVQIGNFHNRLQLRQSPDFYHKIYPANPRVMLEEVDVLTATRLFPGAPNVGSAAFMPLIRQHKVMGSLHFASSETDRFCPSKETDLLEHLAAVSSVCISHCLAREEQELQQEIDPKLQIGSLKYLQRALARELDRTALANGYVACVVVELDFPEDELDQPLVLTATGIREAVRKVDVCAFRAPNQIVVLLPQADSRQAQATALRIAQGLLALEELPHQQVKMGVNAWKARKSKTLISPEKLAEVGTSLLDGAATNAERLPHYAP